MNYSTRFKTVMTVVYIVLILCFIGLPVSFLAFGSDMQTMQSPLYPYRSTMMQQDDFITGNGSGSWGVLGWTSAGTLSVQGSETNRPGILRIDTGAVSGTQARISYSNSGAIDPAAASTTIWATRLNTNDANTTLRIGLGNSVATSPPGNGIYFEKLDADTNWFCVTRAAAVQTRTDSGIAVNTSFNTFSMTRNSSGALFYLNNALVCTHTTNIPTQFISPYVFIINSAAAAKTVDVDYFQIMMNSLVR